MRATTSHALVLYRGATGIYGLTLVLSLVAFARREAGLARVASGMLVAGLALHLVTLGSMVAERGWSIFTTPFAITSGYIFVTLLFSYLAAVYWRMRVALCVLFLVPVSVGLASLVLDPAFSPFGDRLDNVWLQTHLVLLILTYAAFTLAGNFGLMLVLCTRNLKSKQGGLLAEALPPLMHLDQATMAGLYAGFTTLTMTHAVGLAYALKKGWEVEIRATHVSLAMALWLLYAGILVGRRRFALRGDRVGWLAVAGGLGSFLVFLILEYVR